MSPATLTFTPGNWDTAQTVTVEADQDDDAEDDEATVEHEVSGGDYGSNGVTAADVAVTVDDDETASAKLTLSVEPPSVAEDAGETEVTVTGRLDGAPRTSATEVAVSVGASADTATEGMDYATVGELTLTIEAGATEGTTIRGRRRDVVGDGDDGGERPGSGPDGGDHRGRRRARRDGLGRDPHRSGGGQQHTCLTAGAMVDPVGPQEPPTLLRSA